MTFQGLHFLDNTIITVPSEQLKLCYAQHHVQKLSFILLLVLNSNGQYTI